MPDTGKTVETQQVRMDLSDEYINKIHKLKFLTHRPRNQAVAVAIDIAISQLEPLPEGSRPAYINGVR